MPVFYCTSCNFTAPVAEFVNCKCPICGHDAKPVIPEEQQAAADADPALKADLLAAHYATFKGLGNV